MHGEGGVKESRVKLTRNKRWRGNKREQKLFLMQKYQNNKIRKGNCKILCISVSVCVCVFFFFFLSIYEVHFLLNFI